MGDKSRIEWTDATWTPIRARRRDTAKVGIHCERVSEGCKNCYSASFNQRNLPNQGTGLDFTIVNREKVDVFVDQGMLLAPLRWRRPRKIFVCSQTDLFGEFVADEQIDQVFAAMALCPQHTFQVLTKRPERMWAYLTSRAKSMNFWELAARSIGYTFKFSDMHGHERSTCPFPPPNVWIGVTAENREQAEKRIPLLLQTPAAKRFASVEPMLGRVDLSRYLQPHWTPQYGADRGPWLDWVICGGESGRVARPMHPDWVRSLRDQCQAAGVPFFFKQRGEYCWDQVEPGNEEECAATEYVNPDGSRGSGWVLQNDPEIITNYCGSYPQYNSVWVRRVGKARAGRLFDGREWNQFPKDREVCS